MKFNPLTRKLEELPVEPIKGDKGEQGERGERGPQGFQGNPGEQGPQGIKGAKGDTGPQGIQGLTGPNGDKGDSGKDGINGVNGLDGNKGIDGRHGTFIHFVNLKPESDMGENNEWCFTKLNEIYRKENGTWKFYSQVGGGISRIRTLQDIGNVKLTTLTIGDNLQWNGSYWSNATEDAMSNLNVQLDKVSESVTYIGYAAAGSATNAASWKIKKITTTGDDIAITWADGNILFDNVWDNRASLTYS